MRFIYVVRVLNCSASDDAVLKDVRFWALGSNVITIVAYFYQDMWFFHSVAYCNVCTWSFFESFD